MPPDPLTWDSYKERLLPLKKGRELYPSEVPKKRKKSVAQKSSEPPPAKPRPKIEASEKTLSLKTERALQKGEIKPESKCDLHGKTQKEAHALLLSFIENAGKSDKRVLLIITGKGKDGSSVLRANVPRWCEVAPLKKALLAVRPASLKHGGDGAFYVLLKPKKRIS